MLLFFPSEVRGTDPPLKHLAGELFLPPIRGPLLLGFPGQAGLTGGSVYAWQKSCQVVLPELSAFF